MSVEIENSYTGLNGNGEASQSGTAASTSGTSGASSSSLGYNEEVDYNNAFPSLPAGNPNAFIGQSNMENKLSIKKHHLSKQVLRVPVEERKDKDLASFGNETNKKCEEIAGRLGVKVELCCSKDQTLHIVISGHEEKVNEAKRAIVNELQTEREHKIKIPKDQHKFLIGKAGSILKELQEKTCTKIQVPKSDSNSDLVTITGPREGIEHAVHEIQLIVDEQSKSGIERLNISKLYHPWIRGANNEIANELSQRTGAKINIPPALVEKDEIVISGDREKVDAACNEIKKIYAAKSKLNITKLAIQIAKTQHKLIIGKNGSTVQDIFKDYDVYVQVPKLDSSSETIYLYGEESKLGAALSQVIAKSNSVISIKIDVPSWLHRHMIGEKGANISKITADFPNTHVKFETDDKITVDGPPDEVEKVRERLENITLGLKQVMSCEEVTIDAKFIPQLVGSKDRKTENHIAKLNKEHGVVVRLPAIESSSNIVRVEGPPEAVKKAKLELAELLTRLENERSKDIVIDQKYHSTLIGKNGKTLNEIRAKFNDVQINIPGVKEKSDIITIRGNKNDVEKCFKHMQTLYKDLQESNYKEEIYIAKEYYGSIIGKQGANIRKIRDDTHTRIDIPSGESISKSIVIVGKQENVLKAKRLIEEKIRELGANREKEDFIEIPHQYHGELIGKNGNMIKQIRNDCNGVVINFPPESNPKENRITLKGTPEDIEKAKNELLKLVEQRNDMSYSEEITAKNEYHKFLVGRKGTNVNSLRDHHNVRILFPSSNAVVSASSEDGKNRADIITIIGKKENVKAARAELEETIKNLEEQVTDELLIDPKWHKNFTAKKAKILTEISDENCNVKISFPKATDSNQVQIKGPKDAVDAAKKRILDYVHKLENQVTIEIVIPQQYHSAVIGKKGVNSQRISDDYHVNISFHAKSGRDEQAATNGSHEATTEQQDNGSASPSKNDIVVISGFRDECEKAKEALLALVPVKEEIPFSAKFHKFLFADKGKILKEVTDAYEVMVNVPKKSTETCDYVTVTGLRTKVAEAREELAKYLSKFEEESYSIELTDVKPGLIPQLRGRSGQEATMLEKKFDVRLEFSKKDEPDKIVVQGKQANVEAFDAYLKKKIEEEEAKQSQEIQIDHRVHSRIIGAKGKTLAKIIEKFKVEIKFSGRNSDTVVVKGDNMDAIDDACDHLKNLEEEYLQDVIDREMYTHPSSKPNDSKPTNGQSKGFVVRGAPWEQQRQAANTNGSALINEQVPDTNNMEDFPTISAGGDGPSNGLKGAMSWGPSRK